MSHLDIWSDVACPWCFIGKRRLEKALAALAPAERPTIRWHAYQLMPEFPAGTSTPAKALLEQRFGGGARVKAMFDHVRAVARDEGIVLDVDRQIACNTALAHRAIAIARSHGREDAAVEGFFRAHFEEGQDLAQVDVVVALLSAAVPDVAFDALRASVLRGDGGEDVESDRREARLLGVQGVPFFVRDERLAISGAQEPSTFVAFLREAPNAAS
jgi:predicted DsbA family dithiol-disulfide isomerase